VGLNPLASIIQSWKSLGIGADVTPTGTETTGVGVSGGADELLLSSSPWRAVVKLDFIKAFNIVRRDSMLETVAQDRPELFNYV